MDFTWLLAPPLPAGVPRQHLLYRRLRAAIAEGRLGAGSRLPASRALAAELGIARNTVLHAYEQLAAEGCLQADRHGSRVAALPAPAAAARTEQAPRLSQRAQAVLRPDQDERSTTATWPLAPGMQDLADFPFRAWRACLERAWRQATPRQLGYSAGGGEPALREALADHLAGLRGFAVAPEQVIVTAGVHAALELCARLLADAGDCAWVENPGYPPAATALSLAGLRLRPMAVDAEGMAFDAADFRRHPPRLVLVTPTHQYPSGQELSLRRRLALLDGVQAAGGWIIEDDYDSEFRRGGPALPALFGLRPGAPAIHAGTFSKTLYPGLRIGYLVVPPALAEAFTRAASQTTRPGQAMEQAALADFLRRGHYSAHLRRSRRRGERRQAALREALGHHLGSTFGDLPLDGGQAGLHLVLRLPESTDDLALAHRARELGLGVQALSRYVQAPLDCRGLLLGYGGTPEGQMDEAVRRLRQALEETVGERRNSASSSQKKGAERAAG
ncbi:aminotransferase class I/II-fold pyridoxal phosphate-dependent enzyme [Azoarcus sp. TTM-91]|uniref:MocR-like pyridoxine biosynthesis transcription factor PdxR n=1 Tax=Azoarcus sp. TTM-91 TaxID=2691581 RepID=UPI00145DBB1C|nr:PLP-dependent aminotransferase family protein [Azoarcus sp. TTM-91]NMG37130.1 aminotransferase class I/II-fold pyridoxal phosphate-dependent enzyme [Azoarcus sp. TTM-91]